LAKNIMIKSALRHILVGVLVAASTAILFVWFHSYFLGSNYRWIEIKPELPLAEFHGISMTLAGGGIGILVEDFETTDDAVAGFFTEYAQMRWRPDGASYRTWRNPDYPSINRNDQSLLGALGLQWSAHRENYPGVVRLRRQMIFPLWLAFLMMAAYPMSLYLIAVMRQQQEDRVAQGMCPTCGNCEDDETERCPACDHKVAMA
jgi:hypothetical protein